VSIALTVQPSYRTPQASGFAKQRERAGIRVGGSTEYRRPLPDDSVYRKREVMGRDKRFTCGLRLASAGRSRQSGRSREGRSATSRSGAHSGSSCGVQGDRSHCQTIAVGREIVGDPDSMTYSAGSLRETSVWSDAGLWWVGFTSRGEAFGWRDAKRSERSILSVVEYGGCSRHSCHHWSGGF
jgi:hypothetical protein